MSVISAALDAMFADPNLGRVATFKPESGPAVTIRVIIRRPDRVLEFGDARLHSMSAALDLRVSEVPEPRPGDRLEVSGDAFIIQGEPVRDAERLIWTINLRPA